jgi:pentatricopeptide repeat protein
MARKNKLFQNAKPAVASVFTTQAVAIKPERSDGKALCEDLRMLCKQNRLKESIHILHLMNCRGIQPDSQTYDCLMQSCLNLKSVQEAKIVHSHMIGTGINREVCLNNKLMSMYAKFGSLGDARLVFDEMPERSVVSWTTMIAAYTRHRLCEDALKLFYQMQRMGIRPDQFTFASVLPAIANLVALQQGKKVHDEINRSGFLSNVFVGSALVDMYVKCGSVEDAREVFDKMTERNVVTWTAIMAGYVQVERLEEALKLFTEMLVFGMKPDSGVFTAVLPACAKLAALQAGMCVHEEIIRSGFHSDVFVGSALVDMYAKCGSIEDARKVFDKMSKRDVVLWTAMIVGYAMHGCSKEALQLFEQMERRGVKPNNVTFVGLLSACCHAGLVDDGCQYFDSMSQDYHISPTVEHYCCMVDLLGRAGRLNEARDCIYKMPIKPNVAVWRSLLGACRLHSNIKLGEWAAKHLIELEPENAANYVLLSNIYATLGWWNDLEKVRKIMKDKKVKKNPGCSWIELDNKIHTFIVEDRSHPQTHEIYRELERLSRKMKDAGYVPDTNFVLHDLE